MSKSTLPIEMEACLAVLPNKYDPDMSTTKHDDNKPYAQRREAGVKSASRSHMIAKTPAKRIAAFQINDAAII